MQLDNDCQDLVRKLKEGEEKAVDQLIDQYGARLHVAARLLCGNRDDAQDLMSETIQQVVFSISSFRGNSSFFSWMYGILANINRMAARKSKRSRLIYVDHLPEIPDIGPEVGCGIDKEVMSECLAEAINRLSLAHRDVVLLRYYEELDVQEIADVLGLCPGTVKSRLFHAMRQLKNSLSKKMNV